MKIRSLVMNLRNVQWWQSVFWEGWTTQHNNEHERLPSMMLEKSLWHVQLFSNTIIVSLLLMWWEMATHFSHKGSNSLCITKLEMRKVCAHWILRQFVEKHQKNYMGAALNCLVQYKEYGNDLLERIITGDESWIHFYKPERNVWKKKRKKRREDSRTRGLSDNWC